MKTKLTATILTGILLLGAAAGWAADRTRTRIQSPTSGTCTGSGTGSGSMTRSCGGK